MKRFLKIFAVAAIAVAAAVACIFAGCNKSSGSNKADYNFTIVYADKEGKPAVNGNTDGSLESGQVATQVCIGDNCIPLPDKNVFFGADGKLSFTQKQINGFFDSETDVTEFEFHVVGVNGCVFNYSIDVNGKNDYLVEVPAES